MDRLFFWIGIIVFGPMILLVFVGLFVGVMIIGKITLLWEALTSGGFSFASLGDYMFHNGVRTVLTCVILFVVLKYIWRGLVRFNRWLDTP
jgi:hypothetical protein